MASNVRPLQLAVLQILDQTLARETLDADWSVQGFGVLRLYIRKVGRLHIWDSRLRYPNVSLIHNHSWDLRSTIVSGRVINQRYEETESYLGKPYHGRLLLTGYRSKFVEEEFITTLLEQPRETHLPGDVYKQSAHEVHATHPEDGAITLMERHEDVDGHANVYWPYGATWGDAKPRRATLADLLLVLPDATQKLVDEINLYR